VLLGVMRRLAPGAEESLNEVLILLVVVLNAAAGALVYRREKSAAEPELRNYKEMAHVFASAEQLLDATPTDDIEMQHRILRELGRAALAENAYWLRAHRERPIEQIPGA
jgi:hypothetical protein